MQRGQSLVLAVLGASMLFGLSNAHAGIALICGNKINVPKTFTINETTIGDGGRFEFKSSDGRTLGRSEYTPLIGGMALEVFNGQDQPVVKGSDPAIGSVGQLSFSDCNEKVGAIHVMPRVSFASAEFRLYDKDGKLVARGVLEDLLGSTRLTIKSPDGETIFATLNRAGNPASIGSWRGTAQEGSLPFDPRVLLVLPSVVASQKTAEAARAHAVSDQGDKPALPLSGASVGTFIRPVGASFPAR